MGFIRRVGVQMLVALRLLRKEGIIHCDLKPENVLLREAGKTSIKASLPSHPHNPIKKSLPQGSAIHALASFVFKCLTLLTATSPWWPRTGANVIPRKTMHHADFR
jgi:serine/threonine protein kinase